MLNHALLSDMNELNTFTTALANYCKANGTATVKFRNGTCMDVMYEGPEDLDETENPGFRTPHYKYSWRQDGSSTKNSDLDIVECYHLQSENLSEKLGISIDLVAEDERYPTLVISSDEFNTTGYSLNVSTGELTRVCICAAYEPSECCCGALEPDDDDYNWDY
jgi:hypothetical protein